MNKRILFPLFVINFIVYFVGAGLLPLLPLYAKGFGISATGIGFYIAFIFAAITLGTALTARLSYRFSTRILLLFSGIMGIPALALLGRSSAFWQVVLLTAVVWFLAGMGTALVNIQAGLHAPLDKRGKSFGIMFLALPVASLVAGLSVGRLIDWQSFRFMFDVLAVLWAFWPVMAVVGPNEKPDRGPGQKTTAVRRDKPAFSAIFYLLVVTTLLSATTYYLTRLGTTFSMSALGFPASAISGTSSIGGLVAIPTTYLIGSLSDRLSRKYVVILGYGFAVLATLTMSVAHNLWLFWLATGMLYMSRSINGSVAPALATDLLNRESLGRGLSYLGAVNWMAGIFGSAIAGFGIENLGQMNLFLLAAGLATMAIVLMISFSNVHPKPAAVEIVASSSI